MYYSVNSIKKELKSYKFDTEYSIKSQYDSVSFFNELPSDSSVLKCTIYYHLLYPNIVLAQAKLESGNYRSNLAINHNNLFGIYDNVHKRYAHFNHWTESILAYKKWVQYKYSPFKDSSYYNFILRINYAEDRKYIVKLKQIVK